MLSKNRISLIKSLSKRKIRKREGLFVVEGEKSVVGLLHSSFVLDSLYVIDQVLGLDIEDKSRFHLISNSDMEKISLLKTPSSLLAVFKIPSWNWKEEDVLAEFSIALDSVRDPGNLGTIVRIADWFGIENIFCSEDCVDVFNPKCVMSTMGSISRVKVHYVNLNSFAEKLKEAEDYNIYVTAMNGDDIRSEKKAKRGLLVLGNEANGVSQSIMDSASKKIGIVGAQREGGETTESLNVAVATSICCFQLVDF
ncbi:MAG: RNA methyltransferase [Flavobacteriales bacterium]|nr:RNA methyltransferase [Flavobacteriales bacterium]